ncbi:MAG: hypothetical protein WCK10_00510 [Candidatus Staskawiczbacteria bacterium]
MKNVSNCFPQGSAEYVVFHGLYKMRRKCRPSAILFTKTCCPEDERLPESDRNPRRALLKAVHVLLNSDAVTIYHGYSKKFCENIATINYVMNLLEINKFFVPSTYTAEEKLKIMKDLDLLPYEEIEVV